MGEDLQILADDIGFLRTATKTPTISEAQMADRLNTIEASAKSMLLRQSGQKPGILSRVFGFDPSSLYLILQLVLMVVELIRQIRQLRKPAE